MRFPYFLVRVIGPSMEPTLRNGDVWVASRRVSGVSVGDVVVFAHPLRTSLTEVKRVMRPEGDAWWLEGDNAEFSTDSRSYGPVPQSNLRGIVTKRISAR
ncbi:MAG: S26 family signal peptidase [Candidatus Nanopelagicales bacterium]|nr:S26 family signal peptidase [Candidatus Nanopelagicales bacterium]MCF8551741.1 S26 family signal peptidase [Candidatus Nanopelagicales bacterium]